MRYLKDNNNNEKKKIIIYLEIISEKKMS